ncbi:MAG: lysylphosphatidylglycerol synthase transmembrane domain-containing protein [Planctomycetota bacterium]|nr:lysylphosphatidylglycerol synthase transmembrane domain-containing protein [Planctomycetota bacterium]
MGEAKTKSGGLLRFLKPLFAIAILGLVAWMLPWEDRLTLVGPGGDEQTLVGDFAAGTDWKQAEVLFQVPVESLGDAGAGAAAPGELVTLRAEREGDARLPVGDVLLGTGASWEPGMPTVFGSVEPGGVALAMVLFMGALLFGITRWWRLLMLAGCTTTWWNVLRLTYLGLFFNLVMPGLTGGDVAKAVIVVREHPERRGRALMSVVVDRLIGLGTLAVLALVVILISGETFAPLRLPMLGFCVAGVGGALLYFNGTLRRLFRFDALLDKLPLGDKLKTLDEAARLYFAHPIELGVAMVLSLGNHASAILAVWALGTAFGVTAAEVSVLDYFALVPVANIVSSVPIAPAGWGVGEAVYAFLFQMIHAPETLGVAISASFRICQVLLSLLGGLFLLSSGARVELEELEAEVAEVEASN